MTSRILRWGAPVTYVSVIVLVGVSLVAVLTRSPDTRSNFQVGGVDYSRTRLASMSGNDAYDGLAPQLTADAARTYVDAGCAQCHGLKGEGGTVGPEIWSKDDPAKVIKSVRDGGGGMPKFTAERVSDEQVKAIVTYLNEQRQLFPGLARPSRSATTAGTPKP